MTPRATSTDSALARFSLGRRITVLVLMMTALVVGIVTINFIPVELIPKGFDDPFLRVYVPYQDSPPQELLEKIVIPLEEELSTVRGVSRVGSWSLTGRAIVYLNFKYGTDMDVAYREVRDRVERARRLFPDEIDRVYVQKHDENGIPVQVYGVAVDPDTPNVYDLVQRRIVQRLQRIDGVANVAVDGLEEKEIIIELDRERTASAGLNIYELASKMANDNFTLASGPVFDGSRKLLLRSVAEYETLEQLEDLHVAPRVRLRDVATIKYEEAEKNYRVRANSKPAFALVVLKEGDANTREVAARVDAEYERLRQDPRLSGFEMIAIFDQGEAIDEALATLLHSGLIGGFIAALVLFFFLRRFRMMVVVAGSIPLSTMVGLSVMYFAGETLNMLSLLGLMICIGLLVDNSVVVAENIHRLFRSGLTARDAAIRGTSEISLAITMSTMTTVIVFLPVSLVEGPARFFLLRMSIPICVSLVASLGIALVIVPLAVYLTLRGERGRAEESRRSFAAARYARLVDLVRLAYERSFGPLGRAYQAVLAFFIGRRLEMVMVLVLVLGFTLGGPPKEAVAFVNQQEDEAGGVEINVEFPSSYTLEETAEWFAEAERIVEDHAEELGVDGWLTVHRRNFGELEVWFTTPRKKGTTPRKVTEQLLELLPEKPGMTFYTGVEIDSEESKGPETFLVTLQGEDPGELDQLTETLQEFFVTVPGVLGVKKSNDEEQNELGLVVDREKAQHLGANPKVIASVVGSALRGMQLPKFNDEGVEVPVRVRFEEADRKTLDQLESFLVPTENGALPISALTRSEVLQSPSGIYRSNQKITSRTTLELEEGKEKETRERLGALLASIDLPEGVSFGVNAQAQQQDDDFAGLFWALLLSVIFIYLLMGFLFESFILPLSILLTMPLAWIGVSWTHWTTGRDIDFLGAVGVVLLVGVVVNNGIVLIDYVGRLRAAGHSRREAVLMATERRFRPIMMTAITTVGGMVPLALAGATSIGLSYTSFALTLIGGMTSATLLTLLVVPVFYTLFDDARESLSATVRSHLGGPVSVEAERGHASS